MLKVHPLTIKTPSTSRNFSATQFNMVKIVVGMMGSSVASGSSSMGSTAQVQDFLSAVKSHRVRELDTARVYNGGRSEELLGKVNACGDFAVSTKAPAFAPHSLQEGRILAACAASLQALKASKVDIYYLHGPDPATPLEEQCRAIGKLYAEGKFERFGVSNLKDEDVQRIYDICLKEGYCLPTVYQGGYSPLHRGSEGTLFPLLQKLGISFYAFSPLAGGLLAKPIAEIRNPKAGSRYDAMKVFGDMFLKDQLLAGLEKFTRLCDSEGVSVMEATMRWFMHHAPLRSEDAFILGASSKKQVEESLEMTEKGPLSGKLQAGIQEMWEEIKEVSPGYKAPSTKKSEL